MQDTELAIFLNLSSMFLCNDDATTVSSSDLQITDAPLGLLLGRFGHRMAAVGCCCCCWW